MNAPGPKVAWTEGFAYAACVLLVVAGVIIFGRAKPSAQKKQQRVSAVSLLPSQPDVDAREPDGPPNLRARIEAVLEETSTPGAGVAIVRRDGPEWIAGIGVADVALGSPATPETLFRLGSTSKIFVALATLKLEAEGKLSLQDTLQSRAPDLPSINKWEATEPVRIVHLLEHTSGWDDLPLKAFAHRPPIEQPLQAFFPLWESARRTRWKPGTLFLYSNAGTSAAAYVVEKVAGEPFESYIQRSFFDPLKMPDASYFDTPEVQSRLTRQYRNDGRTTLPYWRLVTRPAGAVSASPREMANLLQLFINRGEFAGQRVLPEAAFDRMEVATSSSAAREGLSAGYGLCLYSDMKEGRVYYAHAGGVIGGLAELAYIPELGVGYVFMINSGNGKAYTQIGRLIRSHTTQGVTPPVHPDAMPVSASIAADYDGWYELANLGRYSTITRPFLLSKVKVTNRELEWRSLASKVRLVAVNDRLFRLEGSPIATVALVADRADGNFIQVSMMPGLTFRRLSGWWAWTQIIVLTLAVLFSVTSFCYALLWLPRWLMGRIKGAGQVSLRALPLLAVLCLVGIVALFKLSTRDLEVVLRLGQLTPWSLGLCLLTLAFPVFAGAGIVQSFRLYNSHAKRVLWWHSFATSFVMTSIAIYLAYGGAVGLRTWA